MPLPKAKELRDKTVEELNKMLSDYRRQYLEAMDPKSPIHGKLRSIRRTMARILTVLREKGRGGAV